MLVMVDEIVTGGEARHSYALGLTRLEPAEPLVRIDEYAE